MTEFLMV